MCCCKLHLHARWSINALLECCKLQSINLGPVKDYYTSFSYLSENCRKESTTHLSWECVSNKKTLCSHLQQKWTDLVRALKGNKTVTVTMYHFKRMPYKKKNGQIVERLKAVKENANITFIIEFIDNILAKTLHHCNRLPHFRKNLSVPVKYKPQSLHWEHEQLSVHSGILKIKGNKKLSSLFI